jgi:hypothetical protein
MKKATLFFCFLLFAVLGCQDQKTEKFQNNRNNIINVADKITDIKSEIIFGNSLLYIIDDILIINEISPKKGKGIHLFDKNTFKYITSTGIIGRGPGEISVPGNIVIDKQNRILWVPDHGKKVMWKYPLDSILGNEKFIPSVKLDLNYESFMDRFDFLNDSIVLGKAVKILKNGSFEMTMSKMNLNSNKIEKFGYENAETIGKKSNSVFTLSLKNNLYVNCYYLCDLVTICDLNGNLEYNIYGHDRLENKDLRKSYFFGVDIFDKYIIASYIGDTGLIFDNIDYRGNSPSKFIVFDMKGNYIETIETGHKFSRFCVDQENKRIIAYFDERAEALGYFTIEME